MDDPNITMKEYIRLEEEKARRCDIVFNDKLTFEEALSCEPTVSPLNDNEIDFRISFDESDEKDYTMIYDKNSFSYKIISVNDLKTDSENDNDKVNMPSFSFLTEPTVSPQHIDEFNLKDETSLSECDEEEQNVICFNDLFPFNVIFPNDSKSDKDTDDDKIDMIQSSGNFSVKPLPDVINTDDDAYVNASNKLLEARHDTSNKIFKTETFIKELNVNIVACINTAYPGEQILRIDFLYSFRRHFKTLSLDELRSPDFNLLSDQEYSEEEVAKKITETMEQYMSKTRADYGSWVARPKIKDKDNFKLKGQFLKELRTNTFSGSDHEDANEHV
ncbi:hypothetical protein Tco_0298591, partial [Tanacetum coccineum]